MKDIRTYKDLLEYLSALDKKQLEQPVQIADQGPMLSEPIPMKCGIAIGTMDEMEFYAARSVTDNRFHPEEICILVDGSGFGEDGYTAISFPAGSPKKRKAKKGETPKEKMDSWLDGGEKIYGPGGPTLKESQLNPKFQNDNDDDEIFESAAQIEILKNRMKSIKRHDFGTPTDEVK